MIVYLFAFSLLFLSTIAQYYKSHYMAFFLFFSGLVLSIFVNSFRDMIGGYDIYIYSQYFDNVLENGNFLNYELGFYYLNVILNYVYADRYFFFAILGLIFILSFYIFSVKVTKKLSFLVFFLVFCKLYFYSFVYLRQMFAVILVWFSFYFILEKNKKYFIIFFVAACLFHVSAAIAFFAFFMKKIFNIKTLILLFILGLVLGFFVNTQQLFMLLGGFFDNQRLISNSGNENAINYFYFLEATLIFIWLLARYDFYKKQEYKMQIVFNLCVVYVLFNLLTISDATALRMSWFFLIGPILFFVSELNSNIKGKNILFFFIIIYFSLIFLRIMFVWDGGDFIPYKSIFEDGPRFGRWEFLEYK